MHSFRRLTISTLVAVYLLILVGGVVRSTGSGMGCPDWPKCFGSWVPPTSADQLPSNYKDIYSNYRQKKNEKFAAYLSALGFQSTADKLLNDKSVREEADFNPTKTLIEYGNRIVGVIIGLLIFAVAVASLRYWHTDRAITLMAIGSFLLVGFQGWIGSFVVSSNLTPWTVTVHMFLALVIVAMLIWMIIAADKDAAGRVGAGVNPWLVLACIAVLFVQILLGTRLREAIDMVSTSTARESWLEGTGGAFIIHRAFSWIVLILHGALINNLRKTTASKVFPLGLILLILGTIFSGVGMAWFAMPPWLQPTHLLFATATFGAQFFLLLKVKGNVKPVAGTAS